MDARESFNKWLADNKGRYGFTVAFDPAGKFEFKENMTAEDMKAMEACSAKTITGAIMGGNMIPAMPVFIVVDPAGRFVGSFGLGP